ncbi:DNA polymerase III subunit delta [Aquisphaera giovannonii]|uniref:DNA polymerase III subunit delta n=1 Tax=Aquisphaera giovannonii TaxID=406548 RepID=A0A5B9W7Q8_9BACT|nr:DNA polymerase III subunit delta [Aquisphaera giovannonii]QEH36274.1 DNA polymerase III subunit delta [Aquisphaera giovannonii]
MRALDWLRDWSSQPGKPVYVVYGDDVYLRRESVTAIRRAVLGEEADELALRRFEGSSAGLADVKDELRTLPFFSKRRIVLIEDADPFVTRARKDLEGYLEAPSGTGVLVLLVKSWPSNTKLYKLVAASGMPIDCTSPAEKDLIPWLVKEATRHQAQLEPDAARLLLELVGAEVGILAAEVEKLAVYVGTSARIRRADVTRMVEAGRIETVWKVIDAATTGEPAAAITDLDDLIASGEHPIKINAALASSLIRVHHAGRLRAARIPLDEACKMAGIHGFGVEKVKKQHAHLGPGRVDRIPEMLLKADLDLKGDSKLEPRVILEELLIRLALPRKD